MNFIAVSQSVEVIKECDECRDYLDQRWFLFLSECGFLPLLIPNNVSCAKDILINFHINQLNGILLTGGNDLSSYGGNAPERDKTEYFLIDFAISKNLPLIGICRGMQMIQHFFGVELKPVEGHIKKDHLVKDEDGKMFEVNSYHKFGTTETIPELEIKAKADDEVIESVCHKVFPIYGFMWHPERNRPFVQKDVDFFKKFYGVKTGFQLK